MIYTADEIKKRKERRQKIKKRIVVIVYIILIPLLLYNVSLILQSLINSEETPKFFGVRTFVIISGSMEPTLNIGDIIIVEECDTYEEGDIVSFRQNQSVVTHRITSVEVVNGKNYYKTQGDNNNAEDSGTITDSLIEGKVIKTIPYIGKVLVLLQGKGAIVFIIILLYIYIAHSGARDKKRRQRRIKRLEYERSKID